MVFLSEDALPLRPYPGAAHREFTKSDKDDALSCIVPHRYNRIKPLQSAFRMSLYYETATFLSHQNQSGSLKSNIFSNKTLKSQPTQVYALASEASTWSSVMTEIIERTQLLQQDRKLSPELALLLVHDLLLTKRGISAPASHPLRLAVERHKARLHAEFVKARLRRACATIDDFKELIKKEASRSAIGPENGGGQSAGAWARPRWVRVNALKSSVAEQLKSTFANHTQVDSIEELLRTPKSTKALLHIDKQIPNLLALPPSTDLIKSPAYLKGEIILQDKASCFPAYLLDPEPQDGACVDACAAPGNKTTHLAAILSSLTNGRTAPSIYACERDRLRVFTLQEMLQTARADSYVEVQAGDFLKTDPTKLPWHDVGCILLDPSCSGSGIVGRDETRSITLPSKHAIPTSTAYSKKRKRKTPKELSQPLPDKQEEVPLAENNLTKELSTRLDALSAFQLKLLLHAFQFPRARKITYSTCSIYDEENEQVVTKALYSDIARKSGWRILCRNEQVTGMRDWDIRGRKEACKGVADEQAGLNEGDIAEACIRCEKGTKEGTQGFFVAAFVRDGGDLCASGDAEEVEWEGFSDGS